MTMLIKSTLIYPLWYWIFKCIHILIIHTSTKRRSCLVKKLYAIHLIGFSEYVFAIFETIYRLLKIVLLLETKLIWENWMFEESGGFRGCSAFRFKINHFPLTQLLRPPSRPYHSLRSTCVTYETWFHVSGHQALPNLIHKEAEDFSEM